ncbi:MAG: DNA primase [Brumimicrobium sp.]
MRRIPQHIIDEIMNTARIEEVIGDYVQLKKSGSNYKGLSPFTEERTPSFMVSPAKQIFKCFSSSKGGTVVTFLMEMEQFSYPEALKWLADRYNIELPEEKPLTPEEQEAITERESLQIINDYARDFFVKTIHESEEGKAIGLSYFVERGFRKDIIEKFQLGYCPKNETSFTETALKEGYKQEYLEKLGLTKTKDDRKFDFFSGRVMFPIHSVSGKVLGFGGRTLQTNSKTAKYFNSPESILYNKSKILYGIYFAKSEIIKHDNCYLVEGYTDVISLAQAGVENVVASSGTALTNDQIKLIQRYTQNITVLYDGDAAGIKASFRGIDLILEAGMNVKVLLFPDGEDPDSYAKKVGADELQKYIDENEKDFVNFKTQVLLESTGNDPIKRANLIKEIVTSIALIPDSITRSIYIKETAEQFQMKEQTLINELNKIRRKKQNTTTGSQASFEEESELDTIPVSQKEGTESARNFYDQEFDLIRILLLYGSRALEIETKKKEGEKEVEIIEVSVSELVTFELNRDDLSFDIPLFKKVFDACNQGVKENILYDPSYFLRHEDQEIVKFVSDLLSPKYELSRKWLLDFKIDTNEEIHKLPQAVKESLYAFKSAKIMARINEIREQLKPSEVKVEDDAVNDLLREQIQLEKIKGTFAKQLGRIII